jgi:uncharacterized SAM-binding protein YcdF (DUF218 family)
MDVNAKPAYRWPPKRRRFLFKCSIGLLPVLLLFGWWGYRYLKSQLQPPEAIFVLGGAPEREVYAASLARREPNLDIWVSSGSNPEYANWVFSKAGIDLDRVHLDYRAVDTVTNFTTLVDDLQQRGIDSIYLVTSDFHMLRASIVAEIVLGSRGIAVRTISVPTTDVKEPAFKVVRDGARAMVWLFTGRTGAGLVHLQFLSQWYGSEDREKSLFLPSLEETKALQSNKIPKQIDRSI